jgi:hypothetical protein
MGIKGAPADNVPELMLEYLNRLHVDESKKKKGIGLSKVQIDAQAIAWECMRKTLQPRFANISDVIKALGGNDSEERLNYLEHRLRVIETIPPAYDKVKYTLDPLAEYLAGLHLIQCYKDNEAAWQEFLNKIRITTSEHKAIGGFVVALRDCLAIKGQEQEVPKFVETELRQLPF